MATEVTKREVAVDKLINALKQTQAEQKMTDTAFAKRLGITRPMWHYIQSGKRKPGLKVFTAVIREFPELQLLVFQLMSEDKAK